MRGELRRHSRLSWTRGFRFVLPRKSGVAIFLVDQAAHCVWLMISQYRWGVAAISSLHSLLPDAPSRSLDSYKINRPENHRCSEEIKVCTNRQAREEKVRLYWIKELCLIATYLRFVRPGEQSRCHTPAGDVHHQTTFGNRPAHAIVGDYWMSVRKKMKIAWCVLCAQVTTCLMFMNDASIWCELSSNRWKWSAFVWRRTFISFHHFSALWVVSQRWRLLGWKESHHTNCMIAGDRKDKGSLVFPMKTIFLPLLPLAALSQRSKPLENDSAHSYTECSPLKRMKQFIFSLPAQDCLKTEKLGGN